MKDLHKITSSKMIKLAPPHVKLMLRLKKDIFNNEIIFLIIIIHKLTTLFIFVNNYSLNFSKIKLNEENTICTFISVLELFGLFKMSDISHKLYNSFCIFFFLIILFLILFFLFLFYRTKKKYTDIFDKTNNLINNCINILIFLFMFVVFFSHSLIQFFSKEIFNFLSFYFIDKTKNEFSFPILTLNFLLIIFINILQYKSYVFFNEPYFNSNFPIQMRNDTINIVYYFIIMNFVCFHHFPGMIKFKENIKYPYEITIILTNVLILFLLIRNINLFNFQNKINKSIKFFLILILVSYSIEEIIKNTIFLVTDIKIFIFLIFIKITITYIIIYLHNLYLKNHFKKNCCIFLFKLFHTNIDKKSIECLFYFQSLYYEKKTTTALSSETDEEENLISRTGNITNSSIYRPLEKYFGNSEELINHLLSILISHILKCGKKNCICNIYRKNLLIQNNFNIEKLFESIYFQIGYNKKPIEIVFLFSDFLIFSKDSDLFAYSILNTYLNKNFKVLRSEDLFHLYQLIIKFVESHHEKHFKKIEKEVNFKELFFDITSNKKISKIIIKFNENFKRLIGLSEKFIYDIKYTRMEERGMVKNTNEVIKICENFYSRFKKIKNCIIKDYIDKNYDIKFELKYKINLFYKIFSYKIPQKLIKILDFHNKFEFFDNAKIFKSSNSRIDKGLYDLPLLNEKFFNRILKNNQIIFEINKTFKIKYFTMNLALSLGYTLDYLIGNDIHIIFPKKLRENHKKVILQHLLVHKSLYFEKKTFAFTSCNKLLPILLKASPFPNLSNNIIYIANIELLVDEYSNTDNMYHFILDGEFELISVTQNLEDNYCIYYELLSKLNVRVLKLFEIQNQTIFNKFRKELIEISKEKYKAIFNSIFNSIFNLSLNEENYNSNVKIKVPKDNDNSGSRYELSILEDFKSSSREINILTYSNQEQEKIENKKVVINHDIVTKYSKNDNKNLSKLNQLKEKEKLEKEIYKNNSPKLGKNGKRTQKDLENKNYDLSNNPKSVFHNIKKENNKQYLIKKESFSLPKSNKYKNSKTFRSDKDKVKNVYYQNENNQDNSDIRNKENNDIIKVSSKELTIKRDFESLYKNLIALRTKLSEYDQSDINLIKLDNILDMIKSNLYILKDRKLKITFNLRHFLYTPFFIVSIEETDYYKEEIKSTLLNKSLDFGGHRAINKIEDYEGISSNFNSSLNLSKIDIPQTIKLSISTTNISRRNDKEQEKIEEQSTINNTYNKFNYNKVNNQESHSNNNNKRIKSSINNKNNFLDYKFSNKIKIKKAYNIILLFLILSMFIIICTINYMKNNHASYSIESLKLLNLLDKQYISLISLHSNIIGMLYFLSDLNEFSFDFKINYFKNKLKYHSNNLKDYKHIFYKIIINNKYHKFIDSFHSNLKFSKILIDWKEIIYESNYDIETDKIISQCLSIYSNFKEDNYNEKFYKNNFLDDIKTHLLFNNNKYHANKNNLVPHKTILTEYFYYLNENIPKGILQKLNELKILVKTYIDEVDNKFQSLILILDISIILLLVINLVFINFYIKFFNDKILESILSILIINIDLDINLKRIDQDILESKRLVENFDNFVRIFNLEYYSILFKPEINFMQKNKLIYDKKLTSTIKKDNMTLYQTVNQTPKYSENTEIPEIKENTINNNKTLIGLLNPNNDKIKIYQHSNPDTFITNNRLISKEKKSLLIPKYEKKSYLNLREVNLTSSSNNIFINNNSTSNYITTHNKDTNNNLYELSNILKNKTISLNIPINKIKNKNLIEENKKQSRFLNEMNNKGQIKDNIPESPQYESIKKYFLSNKLKLVLVLRYSLLIIFCINFFIYCSLIFFSLISYSEKKIIKDSTNYISRRYSDIILISNMIRLSIFKNDNSLKELDPNNILQEYESIRLKFNLALQNNPYILIDTNKINDFYNKNFSNISEIKEINDQFQNMKFNSKGMDISANNIINILRNFLKDFEKYKLNNPNLHKYDDVFTKIKNIVLSNNIPELTLQIDYGIEIIAILIEEKIDIDMSNINKFYSLMLYLDFVSISFQGIFYFLFLYIALKKLILKIKLLLFTSKRYKFRLSQTSVSIR